MATFETVEAYLDAQPERTRARLEQVRDVVHAVLPEGEDVISYDMPTRRVNGRSVVHYAGWKAHVSIYPQPDESEDPGLALDLAPYAAGKGTLKFRHDQELPVELLGRVVEVLGRR